MKNFSQFIKEEVDLKGSKGVPSDFMDKAKQQAATNLGIEPEDFESVPFNQRGGLGRVHQLFGAELPKVIEMMNRELAA